MNPTEEAPAAQSPAVRRPHDARPCTQRGVALVVVLLFLLALTGLAVFSARYASLGEGMARNQLDAERARQAAESALRDAERDLMLTSATLPAGAPCDRGPLRPAADYPSAFAADCPGGQCSAVDDTYSSTDWSASTTSTGSVPWWPEAKGGRWNNKPDTKPSKGSAANCSFNGAVPLGTFTGAAAIPGVARQPEYLIEIVSRGSNRLIFFRITARGFGASENTQVVLQSYFQPPLM
jgi:type IV pilus assembly protein PilX